MGDDEARDSEAGAIYAMRRANGDWFALDDHGRLRVPVFSSRRDGMLARANHWGMQLFKPVGLDARALGDLAPAGGAGETDFWLVESPYTTLKRGHSIDGAQLSLLARNAA